MFHDYSIMVDDIIISLKVIAMIKEGQKVSIHNGLLEIETQSRGFFTALKRWFNNDNRGNTIHYVKNMVNNALNVRDAKVTEALQDALQGINALSVTYSEDATVVANLKFLQEKIKDHIRTVNSNEIDRHSEIGGVTQIYFGK
jgi:spore germination protein GerM